MQRQEIFPGSFFVEDFPSLAIARWAAASIGLGAECSGCAESGGSKSSGVTPKTRTILLTIIATLVVVGVLQNMRQVTLRFILWEASVPLAGFLLVLVGLGFLGGLFWRR